MVNGSPHYATANAFRRALDDRLKTQAKLRSQPVSELRREFLFQRFLALLFANPESQWVLKGGASLLMRLTEARFSRDLDLLHLGELSPTEAVEELRMLTRPRAGDHLTFVIGDGVTYSRTNPIVQIGVTAYIGAKYESFPIDLARDLHLVAIPERIQLRPVAEVPGLPELPQVVVYSLADQVADKVCAMYERYGEVQAPSSRYRDLIDLALIVSTCPLDAEPLSRALHLESLRREMQLPERMIQPGEQWNTGYAAYARRTRINKQFHTVDAALEIVGRCLNDLLDGSRYTGRWIPSRGWT